MIYEGNSGQRYFDSHIKYGDIITMRVDRDSQGTIIKYKINDNK